MESSTLSSQLDEFEEAAIVYVLECAKRARDMRRAGLEPPPFRAMRRQEYEWSKQRSAAKTERLNS